MKLVYFATHPIQYQVPIFRKLSEVYDLLVIYLHFQSDSDQAKAGFNVQFSWDIPLHEGYRYQYLTNNADLPSTNSFRGIEVSAFQLEDLLRTEKPDIVFVNGWFPKANKQIIEFFHGKGVPVCCRGDSTLQMTRHAAFNFLKRIYLTPILRKVSMFFAVGINNLSFYQFMGVPEDKISLGRHCVDTEFFQNHFRQCVEDKSDKIVIGFSGKFISKKNPLELLQAVEMSSNRDRIILLLVGDGPMRPTLVQYINEHEINAKFTGFLNQTEIVADGYCKMDLIVMSSSNNETWGLAINEAMTGGIPAIVSDKVGCAPDLIIEGETGYVYPSGDPYLLSACLDKMIKNLDDGKDFSNNVLAQIEKYSIDNTVSDIIKGLEVVVER